jgi:glutamyl-tRNA synthetase
MSLDEMVQLFDLSKCSKNGAKFDYIKAAWFNHQYLLKQTDQAWVPSFDKVLREQGIEATPEQEAEVVRMMKQKVIEYTDGQGQKHKRNISFVSDLWPLTRFFFVAPESFDTEDKFIRKNWKEGTAAEMQQLADVLATVDDFSVEGQKAVIDVWSAETGIKPWNAWRICLVGEGQGPDMYELAAFLGKDETLRRMSYAIEKLG